MQRLPPRPQRNIRIPWGGPHSGVTFRTVNPPPPTALGRKRGGVNGGLQADSGPLPNINILLPRGGEPHSGVTSRAAQTPPPLGAGMGVSVVFRGPQPKINILIPHGAGLTLAGHLAL
jgi:hypothetical protein